MCSAEERTVAKILQTMSHHERLGEVIFGFNEQVVGDCIAEKIDKAQFTEGPLLTLGECLDCAVHDQSG
jgi:hypothetical protein